MTVYPLQEGPSTPYDTLWSGQEVPVQESTGLERVMLSEDKLYVVLAVVLIIWFGLALLILRTDRKIERMERTLDKRVTDSEGR